MQMCQSVWSWEDQQLGDGFNHPMELCGTHRKRLGVNAEKAELRRGF